MSGENSSPGPAGKGSGGDPVVGTNMEQGLTDDLLLGGKVRLRQPKAGFRAAIDPVILAAVVPARSGMFVELGCGVGAASLCLLSRFDVETRAATSLLGIELQPELANIAQMNIEANGCRDVMSVLQADLRQLPSTIDTYSYDHVFFNPPFHRRETERPPKDAGRARASHAEETALEDWVEAAANMLKPRGRMTMVYRADRLMDLPPVLAGRFGGLTVFPLWPGKGKAAKRILAVAQKGSRGPLVLLPGLTLHQEDGRFTAQAEAVLRGGEELQLL